MAEALESAVGLAGRGAIEIEATVEDVEGRSTLV